MGGAKVCLDFAVSSKLPCCDQRVIVLLTCVFKKHTRHLPLILVIVSWHSNYAPMVPRRLQSCTQYHLATLGSYGARSVAVLAARRAPSRD